MEQPSHWTFPISLYGHITVQFLEKWFPFNLTLCHTVQLEPLIINTATLSLASDEASNLILAGLMVSLWPRSSVTQWSLLLALLSLSLNSLSLSLFWGDSNSHKQNQTTVPTNSLSLLLVPSLSICRSLSLYFSFFLSEVILKATEQRLPVHKHWVPAQSLLLSLCVTKDCQES